MPASAVINVYTNGLNACTNSGMTPDIVRQIALSMSSQHKLHIVPASGFIHVYSNGLNAQTMA